MRERRRVEYGESELGEVVVVADRVVGGDLPVPEPPAEVLQSPAVLEVLLAFGEN